jgi:hypothetical protein
LHNGKYIDRGAAGERTLKECSFSEPNDLILLQQLAKPKIKSAALPSFVADMERKLTIAQLKKVYFTFTEGILQSSIKISVDQSRIG